METASPIAPRHTPGLLKLTLGSIGVVYGDIGTSPLYAFRESLHAMGKVGQAVDPGAVLGLLSLVLWTLLIIVTFKYVLLLLRADNHGEGGILSLMTLARSAMNHKQALITMLGMAGAALFYGDAMITPAISVLSALEGLDLVTHHFRPYVLPAAIVIMVLLFIFQRGGTAKVANFFGPIMMVWFGCLAYGGLRHNLRKSRRVERVQPVDGSRIPDSPWLCRGAGAGRGLPHRHRGGGRFMPISAISANGRFAWHGYGW